MMNSLLENSSSDDDLLFDSDDDAFLELLQKQQNMAVMLLEELEDDMNTTQQPGKERSRSCKRLIEKSSQFWEDDCQKMPELLFIQRFRLSRSMFQRLLSLIVQRCYDSSQVTSLK